MTFVQSWDLLLKMRLRVTISSLWPEVRGNLDRTLKNARRILTRDGKSGRSALIDLRDRASAIEFNVYPNFSASNICLRGTTGSSFDTFREQREHVWFKINIVRFVDRDSIFESRLNNKGNFHCYFLVSEITKIIGTQSGFHFGNQVKEYKNINVYTNFFHLYIPN